MNNKNISKTIISLLSIFLFTIYGFLLLSNVVCTTYINTTVNDYRESPYWIFDNPIITLTLVLSVFIILFLIDRYFKIENISTTVLRIVASIFVCLLGFIWIYLANTHPVHDQSIVAGAASSFINGDYSRLQSGEYLQMYPHQLGIVFIFQLIYSVSGQNNIMAIMVLNVIFMCGTYNFLFMSLKRFTDSVKVHNIYWFITFFSFAPVFYCTFVYGTIIGLFFSVAAIYFVILFLQNQKSYFFIIASILFSISCIAKSNYKIFVIAAFLVIIFKSIQNKKLLFVPFALIITLSMFTPSLINTYYSSVSGMKIENGAPSILWVAMGLQEGPCGNGWYNQYNVTTYYAAGGNSDIASDIAKTDIEKSFLEFKSNPLYGTKFFFEKTISQWNEPSFQSLWMSDYWDNHNSALLPIAENIYHGTLNTVLLKIMDIVALFIWLGNATFYFVKRKSITIESLIFGIIFIGGFIFHMFWEAKALYTMPYFVISMVTSAWGISILSDSFNNSIDKLILKLKNRKQK